MCIRDRICGELINMVGYLEAAPTTNYWNSNVLQDDFLIMTDSNSRIHFSTIQNSNIPSAVCIEGSNLICSGNVTACNVYSTNIATLSNSAMFGEGSNFTMVWTGAITIPSQSYSTQTSWSFSTGLSHCPNAAMSNLVSVSLSNGWMKPPIKGIYTFNYCTGYVILPSGFQQNYVNQSNSIYPGSFIRTSSSGTNPNNLSGSFTTIGNPAIGDSFRLSRYNSNGTQSNATQWYSSISMTLQQALQ
jgi:hypothetical protein